MAVNENTNVERTNKLFISSSCPNLSLDNLKLDNRREENCYLHEIDKNNCGKSSKVVLQGGKISPKRKVFKEKKLLNIVKEFSQNVSSEDLLESIFTGKSKSPNEKKKEILNSNKSVSDDQMQSFSLTADLFNNWVTSEQHSLVNSGNTISSGFSDRSANNTLVDNVLNKSGESQPLFSEDEQSVSNIPRKKRVSFETGNNKYNFSVNLLNANNQPEDLARFSERDILENKERGFERMTIRRKMKKKTIALRKTELNFLFEHFINDDRQMKTAKNLSELIFNPEQAKSGEQSTGQTPSGKTKTVLQPSSPDEEQSTEVLEERFANKSKSLISTEVDFSQSSLNQKPLQIVPCTQEKADLQEFVPEQTSCNQEIENSSEHTRQQLIQDSPESLNTFTPGQQFEESPTGIVPSTQEISGESELLKQPISQNTSCIQDITSPPENPTSQIQQTSPKNVKSDSIHSTPGKDQLSQNSIQQVEEISPGIIPCSQEITVAPELSLKMTKCQMVILPEETSISTQQIHRGSPEKIEHFTPEKDDFPHCSVLQLEETSPEIAPTNQDIHHSLMQLEQTSPETISNSAKLDDPPELSPYYMQQTSSQKIKSNEHVTPEKGFPEHLTGRVRQKSSEIKKPPGKLSTPSSGKTYKKRKTSAMNKSSYKILDKDYSNDVNSSDEYVVQDEELDKEIRSAIKLPRKTLIKLKILSININWEVPHLHSKYRALNYKSSYSVKELRQKCRNDDFESWEDESIISRWKRFCKLYKFNCKRDYLAFVSRKYGGYPSHRELVKFVQFLAKKLPERMLYRVYARFKELFIYYNKGWFSKEECEMLTYLMKKNLPKNTLILMASTILCRSEAAIHTKISNLKIKMAQNKSNGNVLDSSFSELGDEQENIVDIPAISQKVKQYLLEKVLSQLCHSQDIEEWEKFVEDSSSWYRIGKACNLSPDDVKLMYLCNSRIKQLSKNKKISDLQRLKGRLLKGLVKRNWRNWDDVKWDSISKKLNYLGPVYLYLVFRKMVKENVPSDLWQNLGDCINFLLK